MLNCPDNFKDWQLTLVSLFKITFRLSGRSLFIFSAGFDIDLRWLPCVDHRAAQEESDGRELQNKNQFDCQADGTKSSQPLFFGILRDNTMQ